MMKYYCLVFISSFLFIGCHHNQNSVQEPKKLTKDLETKYDSVLAAKYHADEYGMKSYVMAFLKVGPTPTTDSLQAHQLFVKHMENIQRMAKEGDLVLAGPFINSGDLKGIYLFNVTTIEEAEALTKTDPAIAAGQLKMELHPWYGSAALMGVNKIHNSIVKTEILN